MNIIRTAAVELTSIPAIAYRQKLPNGGAGVKLLRLDQEAAAVATIDRRSGEPVPYGKADPKLFPEEAFAEAMELVAGLPYSSRGSFTVKVQDARNQASEPELPPEEEHLPDMVDTDEYKAIVARYGDERGKMNYRLMNKDFIQFAAGSKTVGELVGAGVPADEILLFIVKSRATFLTGKKESLEDREVQALIDTLDEIDPRSAFKELKAHIKRMMARR